MFGAGSLLLLPFGKPMARRATTRAYEGLQGDMLDCFTRDVPMTAESLFRHR